MKQIINTENAPKPKGPYSQAVRADKFLFVSGQLAINPQTGKIVGTNIAEQTTRTLDNIKAILQAANYSLNDIIQTNVYLASMTLFADFNGTYATYFGKNFPARVTVATELMSGALVEISVIAYKE